MYVCIYIYIYIYIYVCVCAHIYIYIYIRTHTQYWRIKKTMKKQNCFLSLPQILMKLQWLRHTKEVIIFLGYW